jgi:hypothetical protein
MVVLRSRVPSVSPRTGYQSIRHEPGKQGTPESGIPKWVKTEQSWREASYWRQSAGLSWRPGIARWKKPRPRLNWISRFARTSGFRSICRTQRGLGRGTHDGIPLQLDHGHRLYSIIVNLPTLSPDPVRPYRGMVGSGANPLFAPFPERLWCNGLQRYWAFQPFILISLTVA